MFGLVIVVDLDGALFDVLDDEDGVDVELDAGRRPGVDLLEVEHHHVVLFHLETLHQSVHFLSFKSIQFNLI